MASMHVLSCWACCALSGVQGGGALPPACRRLGEHDS